MQEGTRDIFSGLVRDSENMSAIPGRAKCKDERDCSKDSGDATSNRQINPFHEVFLNWFQDKTKL